MNNTFFWFHFMDGYMLYAKGFRRSEIAREVARHGKLIRMVEA